MSVDRVLGAVLGYNPGDATATPQAVWECIRDCSSVNESRVAVQLLRHSAERKRLHNENVDLREKLARLENRALLGEAMLQEVPCASPTSDTDLGIVRQLLETLQRVMLRTEHEESAGPRRWMVSATDHMLDAQALKHMHDAMLAATRDPAFTGTFTRCVLFREGDANIVLPELFPVSAPKAWKELALYAAYLSEVRAACVREAQHNNAVLSIAIKTHEFTIRHAPAPKHALFHHAPQESADQMHADRRVDQWESTLRGPSAQTEMLAVAMQQARNVPVVAKMGARQVEAAPKTLLHASAQLAAVLGRYTADGASAPIVVPHTLAETFCSAYTRAFGAPTCSKLSQALVSPAFNRCIVKSGEIHSLEREITGLKRSIDLMNALRTAVDRILGAATFDLQRKAWVAPSSASS